MLVFSELMMMVEGICMSLVVVGSGAKGEGGLYNERAKNALQRVILCTGPGGSIRPGPFNFLLLIIAPG